MTNVVPREAEVGYVNENEVSELVNGKDILPITERGASQYSGRFRVVLLHEIAFSLTLPDSPTSYFSTPQTFTPQIPAPQLPASQLYASRPSHHYLKPSTNAQQSP